MVKFKLLRLLSSKYGSLFESSFRHRGQRHRSVVFLLRLVSLCSSTLSPEKNKGERRLCSGIANPVFLPRFFREGGGCTQARFLYGWSCGKFLLLRRLSTAFPSLSSTHYDCLPDISINCEIKNDARKALNHYVLSDSILSILSDSFKLRSNMCLSLGPIKYDKKSR